MTAAVLIRRYRDAITSREGLERMAENWQKEADRLEARLTRSIRERGGRPLIARDGTIVKLVGGLATLCPGDMADGVIVADDDEPDGSADRADIVPVPAEAATAVIYNGGWSDPGPAIEGQVAS